jgi:tripartite-type tricarboxylate transporter receptor subunit TctC
MREAALIGRRKLLELLFGAGLVGAVAPGGAALSDEDYPSRIVRLVVPFPAGSATDTEARFLAEQVGRSLGGKVIIENKAGANGNIAALDVTRSDPDGYTLLLATNSSHSANVHLYRNLAFDPVRDFQPVARLTRNPLVLVVSGNSPIKSLADLITAAKAAPGKLSFGTGNTGSLAAVQLVKSLAGIDAVRVPYQGTPASITDLIGGRIDFVITDVAVVREFVKSGTLRALGVTTAKQLATMSGVPTMAMAGLPGYEFAAWSGLFAPAKTPAPIVDRLHKIFTAALSGPEANAFFDTVGLEPDPGTPAELADHVRRQTELWGRLIEQTGLEKI